MGGSIHHSEVLALSDLYADLFILILYLRETSDFGDPRALHDKIDDLFRTAEKKAKELNIPEEDILDAKYAISALVDETVLYSSWPLRSVWLNNPLVLEYFNDALAGEVFFERIERIRGDSSKRGVLEIYYMCLLFGFEGKFKLQGSEELRAYINGIQQELDFKSVEKLSPHAEVPKQAIKARGMIPRWVTLASYGLLALTAIVIFVVLKVRMSDLAVALVGKLAGI